MADERDLELLDDYLTHRMGEHDRSAFEQKLQADPDLQNEYALQQRLIKGIRDARVSELKSMLNQVTVPAPNTGSALASKIIFSAVVTIMIAATAWYFTREKAPRVEQQTTSPQEVTAEEPVAREIETEDEVPQPVTSDQTDAAEKRVVESDKNQTSAGTEHSKPSLARKPDPLQAPAAINGDPDGTESASVAVEVAGNNSSYPFHYQFKEGKVLLYGPFDKNLYKIVEMSTEQQRPALYLYYKDHYYFLEEADSTVRPLRAVSDPALLRKLNEYLRSK